MPLEWPYTSAALTLLPDTDWQATLNAIRASGGHLIVNLVGSHQSYVDADGHFSLPLWQAKLDQWSGLGLEPYIADGTIAAFRAVEGPQDADRWGGQPIAYTDLEAMAADAHAAFPGLRVVVGSDPVWLAGFGQPWQHMDGVVITYGLSGGDLNVWLDARLAALAHSNQSRFFYLWALNAESGGSPSGTSMSGDELRVLGRTLLDVPNACGLLIYQYNAQYVGNPDIAAALAELGLAAQSRPACVLP